MFSVDARTSRNSESGNIPHDRNGPEDEEVDEEDGGGGGGCGCDEEEENDDVNEEG